MNTTQLNNLKELRALGARILAEPERYPLGFAAHQFDCGTYACWGGYYIRAHGAPEPSIDKFAAHFGIDDAVAHELLGIVGGFPSDDSANGLGPAAYTELERRLAILDNIIAQHEPQPKGIPSSVRAIFDVETA